MMKIKILKNLEYNAICLGQNRPRLGSKLIFKYLKWAPRNKLGPKWPTKFEFSAKILICGQNTNSTVKPLKSRPNPLLFGLKITQKSQKERETPSLTNQKLIKSEFRVQITANTETGESLDATWQARHRALASAQVGPTFLTWTNGRQPRGSRVDRNGARARAALTQPCTSQSDQDTWHSVATRGREDADR